MKLFGLPDTSIKESKERITFAIKNSGIQFPNTKIIINLSPADIKKEGASYDLPIAIGILQNIGAIKNCSTKKTVFIGELGLDGKINKVNGILAMCLEASKLGITQIVIPKENLQETVFIKNVKIVPVESLKQLIEYLNNNTELENEYLKVEDIINKEEFYTYKFEQIYGQENAKRALEIAVAGNHNCLIIGTPGTRKNIIIQKCAIDFA